MDEISGIISQLKASFEGDAWHGPAVLELLEGVTAEQAAAQPVRGTHSIWELVCHIAAWEDATRRRLGGGEGNVSEEDNFPPVSKVTGDAWRKAREVLELGHQALLLVIGEFPASRLDEFVPGKPYNFYKLLHGVIEHNLYHAGQIALLKKALETDTLSPV